MNKHFLFINNIRPRSTILVSLNKQLITHAAALINLEAINESITNDQLTIVLADHMVSNYQLNLKTRNQAQLLKAASYAVEEKFPGRLEDYHIVTSKGAKNRVNVRAIRQDRLTTLLEHLATFNLKPDTVVVESDLLNQTIPTLLLNEREAILCGESLEQTYEIDLAALPLISENIFTALGNSQELQIIYPVTEEMHIEALQTQAPDTLRIKKILKNDRYYETLCQNRLSTINLLQGKFINNEQKNQKKSFWQYPAWLTAASVIAYTGSLFAQNVILDKRISNQEEALANSYTEIFPGARKPRDIIDLTDKLKSKARLQKTSSNTQNTTSAISLLQNVTQAASGSDIRILGFTLDNNSTELLISGASIEVLNNFKSKLQNELSQQEKNLNMDSVTAKDEQYQAKISIRNK